MNIGQIPSDILTGFVMLKTVANESIFEGI